MYGRYAARSKARARVRKVRTYLQLCWRWLNIQGKEMLQLGALHLWDDAVAIPMRFKSKLNCDWR